MKKKLISVKESRPAWARGLKHDKPLGTTTSDESRPAWARGLKRFVLPLLPPLDGVAPRVGAWIETAN